MKIKIILLILSIILASTLCCAWSINVKANVPKEVLIESSAHLLNKEAVQNEPIIISVNLENKGNQKVYSYIQSEIGNKEHMSSIGMISPLETITKSIAIPTNHLKQSSKLKFNIISTDLKQNITSEEYEFGIIYRNKESQSTKKISLSSKNSLEIGQLNNIQFDIKNNLDNKLENIYIFSTHRHTGTQFIESLDPEQETKLNFQIFIPNIKEDRYIIPFFIYDKKNDILSQSIIEFNTTYLKNDLDIKNTIKDKKLSTEIIDLDNKISYNTLTVDYYKSFFSLKSEENENIEIILFPKENQKIEINNSEKVKLTIIDAEDEKIYSNLIFINKLPIYIISAMISLILSVILIIRRSKKD
ncbi:hypothetical protein GF361_02260 [Candidatus Woesearchaeota archaeon]|nr:hypothetical protein [Candidatus Woesearchaeota archaeon]